MNPTLQRTTGIVRGMIRQSTRVGWRIASDGLGLVNRARHLRPSPKPGMDDVTLARKVESEIFRAAGSPKSTVDVNVVDGVVYLRGEVKRPQQIKSLEARTRAIPEVRGVENLLHLPKTPAPTRADTPRRAQRTGAPRAKAKAATEERTATSAQGGQATRRAAAEQAAEPSPVETAGEGSGRQPAPFGSTGGASEETQS